MRKDQMQPTKTNEHSQPDLHHKELICDPVLFFLINLLNVDALGFFNQSRKT